MTGRKRVEGMLYLYGKLDLVHHPTPKLNCHPLSAGRDSFPVHLQIASRFRGLLFLSQTKDAQRRRGSEPLITTNSTNISQYKILLSTITNASDLQVFAYKRYSYFTLLLPNYNYGSQQYKVYLSLRIKCPIFLSVFKQYHCAHLVPPNLVHTHYI
jgi:hypothetical protein